jgi:uncharacterized repeat protein (TIGR03803 family)
MNLNKCIGPQSVYLILFEIILMAASTASAEWKEKVLYSFQGGTDGGITVGRVVFDKSGNLYGATSQGGSANCPPISFCGTAYQLKPPAKKDGSWTETVLHVFKGVPGNDGATPEGGLAIDEAGNLYGTTGYGGTGDCVLLGIKGGCGTVYELSPPTQKNGAWTETVLYSFKGGKDGYVPAGDVVFDNAGNLYGVTLFGGGKGTTCDPFYQYCGAVFKLSRPTQKGDKWTEKVLYGFGGGMDGASPNGGLIFDSKGAVYGTTWLGGDDNGVCQGGNGSEGCGTVFMLNPPTRKGARWNEKVLYRFKGRPTDGSGPQGGLALSGGGELYGTTAGGGAHEDGVVFELKPPAGKGRNWTENFLHVFTGGNDGQSGAGGLLRGADGTLYGSVGGGEYFRGVIFRMQPPTRNQSGWRFDVLHTFTGSPDGYDPMELTFGSGKNLFGATLMGGTGQCDGGCGAVFEVSP